jgi:argininosuccinate lyase
MNFAKEIAAMLEKFAVDIMLWQTSEYNFWTLPEEYSTGSSIMPQKRNLDIAELLRGRWAKIQWAITEVWYLTSKLPSSYHRDFQYTKEPFMRTNTELHAMIAMGDLIIKNLILRKDSLEAAVTPELYTTYAAFKLVWDGTSFRDAYTQVWVMWKNGDFDHTSFKKSYEWIQKKINDKALA